MFQRRKKVTAAPRGGPWRYLGLNQTMQQAQRTLADVRGLEGIAYPLMALVAWRTYARTRRRQQQAAVANDRAAIEAALAPRGSRPAARRKRFGLF